MKNKLSFAFITVFFYAGILHGQSIERRLQHTIDSFYQAIPNTVGIIIHVESPEKNISWSYAAGYSDKNTKQKLMADQPALIASNTKTYVAAAIVKLAEKQRFSISDPIENLISDSSKLLLQNDGYDLNAIKIKNLLSHTSGISDYVGDDYLEFVNTHRNYHWTRNEQIKRAVDIAAPFAQPGDSFKYADINYLLLTEVIERITQKPFYEAIRELLDYKKLGLAKTWFTELEKNPKGTKNLVHQYWSKYSWDSYDLDPSWDLYGGGGMVATAGDLALFFQRLFEGRIVHNKQLLQSMYTDVLNRNGVNYCLGVRKIRVGELDAYYHGGFWGTDAAYFPAINSSIAMFILQRDERDKGGAICKEVVRILNGK